MKTLRATLRFSIEFRLDDPDFTAQEQLAIAKWKLNSIPGVVSVKFENPPVPDQIHGYEIPGDSNGKILGTRAE